MKLIVPIEATILVESIVFHIVPKVFRFGTKDIRISVILEQRNPHYDFSVSKFYVHLLVEPDQKGTFT